MKVQHLSHIVVQVICALLIALFIYTGINKLSDYSNFKIELGRSPFIQSLNGFIASTLPAGELLIACLLLIKRTRLPGLYLSYILLALFTGYIALMLRYAYDLPCSCGGIMASLSWNGHLLVNALFTGLTITGILLESKHSNT
jgi:TRAP-type C4-dicarboxylate transport system permease small subunit